jgi:hypothetical protein
MARLKRPRSSLALFPQPTRERAYELVARFPIGSRFSQRFNKCNGACCKSGPSHGPYWVVDAPRSAGKPRQRYVGSDERKREIEAAWALISAEIANVEASPAVQELRRLEALAGRRPALAAAGMREVSEMRNVGGETRRPK